MLYNNPIAYGTDFLPEQIQELAVEHENFEAVKESSTDARRVSAIRALLDRRLEITVVLIVSIVVLFIFLLLLLLLLVIVAIFYPNVQHLENAG